MTKVYVLLTLDQYLRQLENALETRAFLTLEQATASAQSLVDSMEAERPEAERHQLVWAAYPRPRDADSVVRASFNGVRFLVMELTPPRAERVPTSPLARRISEEPAAREVCEQFLALRTGEEIYACKLRECYDLALDGLTGTADLDAESLADSLADDLADCEGDVDALLADLKESL